MLESAEEAAFSLIKTYDWESMIVLGGIDGVTLYEANGDIDFIPCSAPSPSQQIGLHDAAATALAAALGNNFSMSSAVVLLLLLVNVFCLPRLAMSLLIVELLDYGWMNFHGNYRYLIDNLNQKRIGFNTIMVLVNMRVIVIGLFSIFLMLFSVDSVLVESDEVDTSIGFDFTFGEIIENEKIFRVQLLVRIKMLRYLGKFTTQLDSNIIGECLIQSLKISSRSVKVISR